MNIFAEPVSIRRGPEHDQYGDPIPGTGSPVNVLALVWGRESTEPTHQNRNGVIVGLGMALPSGTDIRVNDQVSVRGDWYDVEGEPHNWSGMGWNPGIQVALRRAQG